MAKMALFSIKVSQVYKVIDSGVNVKKFMPKY